MTAMDAGPPGVLCLQALRIAGVHPKVLASLVVTVSAKAPGAAEDQPLVLLSSLVALVPAGSGALTAKLASRDWPVLHQLKVAESAASADIASHSVPSLHGDVRIEVSRGQIKKGKLRAVKLFSGSFSTLSTGWGQKTLTGHGLQEVHPQVGSSACIQLQLTPDACSLPLSSASATWPACQTGPIKLLKMGLPRSGTDPCLTQLAFNHPAKAPALLSPSGSNSTPPNPFTSPTSHADLISADTASSSSASSPDALPPTFAHVSSTQSEPSPQVQQQAVTHVLAPPHLHHRILTPFAEPDGGHPQWGQHADGATQQQNAPDRISTSTVDESAHDEAGSAPRGGVRLCRSMADLTADILPRLRRRPAPALLNMGGRTFSTPLESAMSLRCRRKPSGMMTAPASPANSSSSGELDCSAPNTPSYPRPEATFEADRQALLGALGALEADVLYQEETLAVGQRHLVPPLLSDACATPMDGARLIKWMSSCWWMALV